MPYGIDTGGGIGGGLARGISEGAGLFNSIVGGAQDRQLKQQEFGLRQQEALMNMRKSNLDMAKEHLDAAQQAAVAAYQTANGDENDPEVARTRGIAKAALQGVTEASNRYNSIPAYKTINDTMDLSKQLQNKQVEWSDLTPQQKSSVIGLTGQAPIDYIDGHDHDGSGTPGQRAPIGQRVDDFHSAMSAGDLQGAQQHAFHLVAPQISGHDPDHEHHYPGIRGPYEPQDGEQHGHIGQIGDIIGAHATLDAVINSGPKGKDGLTDTGRDIVAAHKDGFTDQYNGFKHFLYSIGGPRNLPAYMMPSEKEQTQMKAKEAGYDDREAFLIAHAPGVIQERESAKAAMARTQLEVGANAGLRAAQVDEARARAKYYESGGHKTGLAATLAPIEDELNDPDTAPERKQVLQQMYDDAIKGAAHRYDHPDRTQVTDADLHKQAAAESQQAARSAALSGQPVPDMAALTTQNYNRMRAARDRGKPGAGGGPAPKAPAVGEVQDGHTFLGGDPADPKNWVKTDGGS